MYCVILRLRKTPINLRDIKVDFYFNPDFEAIVRRFASEISDIITQSLKIAPNPEILYPSNDIDYCLFSIYVDENGVNIGAKFPHVALDSSNQGHVEFYKSLDALIREMVNHTNSMLNKYVELKEDSNLYSFRKFHFIYKMGENGWEYDGFARLTDRPISLQKKEVNALLEYKMDEELVKITEANENIKDANSIAIEFYSDGFTLRDIQLGFYN